MSERSGAREQSEQDGASKRVSGVNEQANGRASSPVPQSRFFVFLDHSTLFSVQKSGSRALSRAEGVFPFWYRRRRSSQAEMEGTVGQNSMVLRYITITFPASLGVSE